MASELSDLGGPNCWVDWLFKGVISWLLCLLIVLECLNINGCWGSLLVSLMVLEDDSYREEFLRLEKNNGSLKPGIGVNGESDIPPKRV